jgi:hypothetical protein
MKIVHSDQMLTNVALMAGINAMVAGLIVV